jgi:hypothetical protein
MREHDVTAKALAEWLGVSRGHLCNTLKGRKPVPDSRVLERIALIFRVRPDVFTEYRERRVRAFAPRRYVTAIDRLYREVRP